MTFAYKHMWSRLLTFTHGKIQHKVDKTHVCSQYKWLMSRLRMRDFHLVGSSSLNPSTKSIETSIRCSHMKNGHLLVVDSRWTLLLTRYDLEFSHLPMAKYSIWLTIHTFVVKIGNLISRLRMRDFHFVGATSLNSQTKSIETSIRGGHIKNGHLLVVQSRWPLLLIRYDLELSHLLNAKCSITLTKHTFVVNIDNLISRLRMRDFHFVGATSLNSQTKSI